MSVARVTEISVGSPTGFEDAIRVGIERANQTLRNVRGAWVKEQHVSVDANGKIAEFRVNLLVTFVLEEPAAAAKGARRGRAATPTRAAARPRAAGARRTVSRR
jgi:hypothetical protein